MSATVLLTGISGFIGLYCAKELLEQGFKVRGTVRSKQRESHARDALKIGNVNITHLDFAILDLTTDDGWDNAMEGCEYVLHVASPFRIANPKNANDMMLPAVEGTKRILRAASQANVKRVVLTSSIVSMMSSIRRGQFGPDDWTDVSYPNLNTYIRSKTLAEKAAWNFISNATENEKLELVVIAPGGVFGPPLGNEMTAETLSIMDKMLSGKIPMVPEAAFPMVDVRDVAKLHVKAMTQSEVAGERFIASGTEPIGFSDIAQILINAGYKGPSTRKAPGFILKFMALFDREAAGMLGILGMCLSADNSKTRDTFNWSPMPFEKAVLETASAIKAIRGR